MCVLYLYNINFVFLICLAIMIERIIALFSNNVAKKYFRSFGMSKKQFVRYFYNFFLI